MTSNKLEFNQVNDSAFVTQHEYKRVIDLLAGLERGGLLERLTGQCIAASEIIQNALDSEGIKSKMVECQALITHPTGQLFLVGYDHVMSTPGQIDTHVVVVVDCAKPILIDASIGYALTGPSTVLVTPIESKDPEVITEIDYKGFRVIYRLKKQTRYPYLHQKNLAHRLAEEAKTRQELGMVRTLVIAAVGIGTVNFTANAVLIFLKVIFP